MQLQSLRRRGVLPRLWTADRWSHHAEAQSPARGTASPYDRRHRPDTDRIPQLASVLKKTGSTPSPWRTPHSNQPPPTRAALLFFTFHDMFENAVSPSSSDPLDASASMHGVRWCTKHLPLRASLQTMFNTRLPHPCRSCHHAPRRRTCFQSPARVAASNIRSLFE